MSDVRSVTSRGQWRSGLVYVCLKNIFNPVNVTWSVIQLFSKVINSSFSKAENHYPKSPSNIFKRPLFGVDCHFGEAQTRGESRVAGFICGKQIQWFSVGAAVTTITYPQWPLGFVGISCWWIQSAALMLYRQTSLWFPWWIFWLEFGLLTKTLSVTNTWMVHIQVISKNNHLHYSFLVKQHIRIT